MNEKNVKLEEFFKKAETSIKELKEYTENLQNFYTGEFRKFKTKYGLKLDEELLRVFFEKPYIIIPQKEDSWYVVVPRFVDFQVGWLEFSTESYNVYTINKYTRWLGELPEGIKEDLKLKDPEKIFVTDSNLVFEKGKEKEIERKYGDLLSSISKGGARIKQGREFDLIAEIIDGGSLPFVPQPVDDKDLREPEVDFKLEGKYQFQYDAVEQFIKYGAVGIYWMTGAGKSFFAMYVLDSLKGKKALIVPTLTLVEQWKEYFTKYAPRLLDEVEIYTYQSYDKIKNQEFVCVAFDECHVLPADTFSKLATLKTKYRFGLSATPYREDGRTNYIFALTGYPLGLSWSDIMKILGKKFHEVNVYIVANLQAKFNLVKSLVDMDKKTIIFVNLIDIGERIANSLGVPFIHGGTKARMNIARESKVMVASRVMELGISLKDLEHIIEVDFLFGSRREEVQRTGRLFHSAEAKVHDIIMTKEEFENYGKRLHGLVEKGFKINLKPMVEGSYQILKAAEKKTRLTGSRKSNDYPAIIEELFAEGYFVAERKLGDISEQLAKRGVTAINQKKANIFSKLNNMVKTKKIYKVKKPDGYYFIQR